MTFEGIPFAALDFYEDLAADNSKTFWTDHKHVYDESVRAPLQALGAELADEFGPAKLFRPYRDVRFSADKTPYKINQGMWFDDTSVYIHVDAAGLMLAGGYWRTAPDQVARLRAAIDNDVAAVRLQAALDAVRKAGFEVGGTRLTRVPNGFAKDHPRADLLRHKTLTAHREYGSPDWLCTPRAKGRIAVALRKLAPLNEWLDDNVGASTLPSHRS